MKNRILVPLDGTEAGEAVLPKLEQLVLKTVPVPDVEVTLLKVIPMVNFNVLTENDAAQLPYTEGELKQLKGDAEGYLKTVGGGLTAKGIKVKTLVAVGHTAEEIVKAARDIDANLIAMATHGRNGFIRWAIGSTTDRVIRLEGKIPVMAIHAAKEKTGTPVIPVELQMKHTA